MLVEYDRGIELQTGGSKITRTTKGRPVIIITVHTQLERRTTSYNILVNIYVGVLIYMLGHVET